MFDLVPFRKRNNDVSKLFDDMEKSFMRNFFDNDLLTGGSSTFRADISDEGDNYVLQAELPGFNKDDITLELNDNVLTISAKKDEVKDEKNDNYIRKERHFGEVSRSFVLDNVKPDQINASHENGILKVTLPKEKQEAQKSRKIDIN